jgi:hypothetical protein
MRILIAFTIGTLLATLGGCSCNGPLGLGASRDGASALDGPSGWNRTDACGDGIDDDADARIDEGCPCAPGEPQRCFTGSHAARGRGTCADGVQTCIARGVEWGDWGDAPCVGGTVPGAEQCDGADHDCDSAIDESCPCTAGEEAPCGVEHVVAPCTAGVQTCRADGTWGGCEGAIGPMPDVCDGADNDCDGDVDVGCDCVPSPEICRDLVDNDCDGAIDEPACDPDWPSPAVCGADDERCGDGDDDDRDGTTDEGCLISTCGCAAGLGAASELRYGAPSLVGGRVAYDGSGDYTSATILGYGFDPGSMRTGLLYSRSTATGADLLFAVAGDSGTLAGPTTVLGSVGFVADGWVERTCGGFVVVWSVPERAEVRAQRFDAAGTPATTSTLLFRMSAVQSRLHTAVALGDDLWIAWSECRAGDPCAEVGDREATDLFVRRYSAASLLEAGPEIRVSRSTDRNDAFSSFGPNDRHVAVASDGATTVVVSLRLAPSTGPTDVIATFIRSDAIAAQEVVGRSSEASFLTPVTATAGGDRFLICYARFSGVSQCRLYGGDGAALGAAVDVGSIAPRYGGRLLRAGWNGCAFVVHSWVGDAAEPRRLSLVGLDLTVVDDFAELPGSGALWDIGWRGRDLVVSRTDERRTGLVVDALLIDVRPLTCL